MKRNAAICWGVKKVLLVSVSRGQYHLRFLACGQEYLCTFFSPGATQPIMGVYFTALYRALASSRTRLLDHTQRRATVGRTPLNE
jgi:hypothetical protein